MTITRILPLAALATALTLATAPASAQVTPTNDSTRADSIRADSIRMMNGTVTGQTTPPTLNNGTVSGQTNPPTMNNGTMSSQTPPPPASNVTPTTNGMGNPDYSSGLVRSPSSQNNGSVGSGSMGNGDMNGATNGRRRMNVRKDGSGT